MRYTTLIGSSLILPEESLADNIDFINKLLNSQNKISNLVSNISSKKTIYKKRTIEDIFVKENERKLFDSTFHKVKKVLKTVGYGNFNYISFDDAIKYVKFKPTELNYLEKLFEFDAKEYGFNGKKVITNLTNKIEKKEIQYIKGTGHFLFKDVVKTYDEMLKESKEFDPNINPVLTSGVRNIFKQIYLFMNKTKKVNYNLSEASYSLAPPGHSYHGISDLDIGRKYAGNANFDLRFLETEEYQVLNKLNFLSVNQQRYHKGNKEGVRFEPWHVKINRS